MNKKQLGNFIEFSLLYANYIKDNYDIFANSYKLDIFDQVEYKKLAALFAILNVALFKEDCLSKDENKNLDIIITDDLYNLIINNIAKKNGNNYSIGSIDIKDKKELFEIIRNKVLHGDFYFEDDYLVLNNDGQKGKIKLDAFIEMSIHLVQSQTCNLVGKNTRPMVINRMGERNINLIQTRSSRKKIYNNTYYLEIIDEPVEGYQRDSVYVNFLDKYLEFLQVAFNDQNKSIQNILYWMIDKNQDVFNNFHMKVSYKLTCLDSMKEKKDIEKTFLESKILEKDGDIREVVLIFFQIASDILCKEHIEKYVTANAIMNNILFLFRYCNNKNFENMFLFQKSSSTFYDDITIASTIINFYLAYHYGLDKIFSNGGDTTLKEIVDGKYFDYSKLELDNYFDENMTIDCSFVGFNEQLKSMENEINKIRKNLSYFVQQRMNYLNKGSIENDILRKFEDKILEIKTSLDEKEETYLNAKYFMDNNFIKYVRNYNIIAHLRNSIAHGNFQICPYEKGDTLQDRDLSFKDVHKGKITYSKIINYEDFLELLKEKNIIRVYHFLYKEVQNEDFVNKM